MSERQIRRSVGGLAVLAVTVATTIGVSFASPREDRGPSLTVYSGNLALVRREVVRVLDSGVHTVRVDGLPTNVDESSVMVLNPGVTLLGTHGLRSYRDAAEGAGASIDLDLEVEGGVEVLRLAYLTTGLSWSADYAVVVAADDATARVDGYATLTNGSGTSYARAEVQLLAGTIQRGDARYQADEFRGARMALEESAVPGMERAAFGDYYLYTISTPLTLRSGEARRIRLMGARSARARKLYKVVHSVNYHQQSPEPTSRPAAVSYRIERPESSELGEIPLPGGQVRVYQRDAAGRIQLLGISGIGHTPTGEDLELATGYAFDIRATRTQTDYARPSGGVYESAWKVELTNESASDVEVQVIERLTGDWRIVESSHEAEKLSAGAVRFRLTVPAGGTSTLTYRISVST